MKASDDEVLEYERAIRKHPEPPSAPLPNVPGCRLCQAGYLGGAATRAILTGRKSPFEVAAQYGMEIVEIMEHVNKHEIVLKQDSPGRYQSPDWYLNEMLGMFNVLRDWIDYLMEQPKEVDTRKITALTTLTKEVRATLVELANFQGRIQKGEIHIDKMQVNNIAVLTDVLLEEACDECRLRMIEALEKHKRLPGTS